eukprot:11986598-Heterocapsa_arctica.AAC.1
MNWSVSDCAVRLLTYGGLVYPRFEFVGFPIELYVERSKEKEVTDSEEDEDEKQDENEGDEPKIEE